MLNILAGRTRSNGNIHVDADVRLNNYQVDPANIEVRKKIAFVAQDDSLQVTSTPREAIRFSAKLRLPKTMTDDELDRLTNRMLNVLGLEDCADVLVGSSRNTRAGRDTSSTPTEVRFLSPPEIPFNKAPPKSDRETKKQ